MTKARTSETLLRQNGFTFLETRTQVDGEMDVYRADPSFQIHVSYDDNDMPAGITLCAPALGVGDITVFDDDGSAFGGDELQSLLYELIDDAQFMYRMTGLKEESVPDFA